MNARRRTGAADAETEESEGWVITYGDMMTLLVAFFVMLLSMATFVPERLYYLSENEELKRFRKLLEQTYAQMETYVRDAGLQELIIVEKERDRIKVTLSEGVSFPTGKAELKEEARPILDYIGDILQGGVYEYKVNVVGHTDNVPIHTDDYPSNWELSSKRAIAVVEYYVQERGMTPEQFRAEGRAEYEPIASNDTPAGRAKNRRVEIFVAPELPSGLKELAQAD